MTKELSSLRVTDELEQIIRDIADSHYDGNMAAATRGLIVESPRVVKLAKQRGIKTSLLLGAAWGGSRKGWVHLLKAQAEVSTLLINAQLGIGSVEFDQHAPDGFHLSITVSDAANGERTAQVLREMGLMAKIAEGNTVTGTDDSWKVDIAVTVPEDWKSPTRQ